MTHILETGFWPIRLNAAQEKEVFWLYISKTDISGHFIRHPNNQLKDSSL